MLELFGRLHPLILHVPIGLFFGLIFFEVLSLHKDNFKETKLFLTLLCSLTFILTMGAGLLLESSGAYTGETIKDHKLFAISLTIFSLATSFFYIKKKYFYYRLMLITCMLLLPITGHLGGILTHGKNWLPLPWAQEEATLLKQPVKNDHATVIEIFSSKCKKCHGPEKQKGGIRLDQLASLYKTGKSGEVPLSPGSLEKSSIVNRILLPTNHDDVMPPEGKASLTNEEKVIIVEWIKNMNGERK